MSASANLDLVRSIFAAWEQGDFSMKEGLMSTAASVYLLPPLGACS